MNKQIDCNVTRGIYTEEMIFHQQGQLKKWLAKIKTNVVKHGLGILDKGVGIGQDFDIDRIPKRSRKDPAKSGKNQY